MKLIILIKNEESINAKVSAPYSNYHNYHRSTYIWTIKGN